MTRKAPRVPTLKPRLGLMPDRLPSRPPSAAGTQGLYGYKWKQERRLFLRAHPLCQCQECDEGRKFVTPSSVVDHKIPHRGDLALFWDQSNWQALAKPCHDRKTAKEDGGFGNVPKF